MWYATTSSQTWDSPSCAAIDDKFLVAQRFPFWFRLIRLVDADSACKNQFSVTHLMTVLLFKNAESFFTNNCVLSTFQQSSMVLWCYGACFPIRHKCRRRCVTVNYMPCHRFQYKVRLALGRSSGSTGKKCLLCICAAIAWCSLPMKLLQKVFENRQRLKHITAKNSPKIL